LSIAILGAVVCLIAPHTVRAQRSRDPLTPAQEEQVRAVADQPNERVKLYLKFIEEHTEAIHHAVLHPATQHPGAAIHDNLEDFTRLVDELQDNLDAYDESHSDVRKSLKILLEHAAKWSSTLDEPPGSPDYDFARKSAIDAVASTKQAATELMKSQDEYFSKHKAEKEPKKKSDE
jgi:hypothetical protein